MIRHCAQFQKVNAELIIDENRVYSSEYTAAELAGHDFWLTRNGHGAGFWDGDWQEPAAAALTAAAHAFGEVISMSATMA